MSAELGTAYHYFDSLRDCDYDTWFDKLPPHWEVKKISHVVKMQSGDSIESSDIDPEGDFPVYGGNGLRGYAKNYNLSGHYALIGRQGALCGNVNFSKGKVWVSEHAVVVYPLTEVDVKWLGETLRAMDLNQYNVSAAQPGLSISNLTCLRLPFPPYTEQQKIANFLDHETAKIDTLIEKQQQLIKLLKEKRQAEISHAVTKGLNPDAPMKDSGVEWLGEVPEHWAVTKLSNRYQVLLGKMLDQKKISGSMLGEYLRNTDVQWGKINTEGLPVMDFNSSETARYTVTKGDLLVCEGGEIGRCAIWDEGFDVFYQKALHRLRPIDFLCDITNYFRYVLSFSVLQGRFESGSEKATIAHLPAETFRQYKFAFPPLKEQKKICAHLDALDQLFIAVESNVAKQLMLLQERRTALISAAVTGKIDVRNWQPPADTSTSSMDA